MSDLISRKALCEYCLNTKDRTVDANDIMRFPSAEPERTVKVEVHSHPCGVSGKCCACGGDVYNGDPYCSHCGTKLDWSGNE